ncbi:hypothetical protein HY061_02390 [Candidatus Azambacteria bacterium]|nr:hypothetical protein [Candidatus Azambacteria bacterium]
MNSLFFINYKYFRNIGASLLLLIFIFTSILGGLFIPKKVEALNLFSPVKKALEVVLKIVIPALTKFVVENQELVIAAAGAWGWSAAPVEKRAEVLKTVKSVATTTLLTLITNDIITEIQGGTPTFIGNWGKFFDTIGNEVLGKFFSELAGFDLCSASAPNIRVLFNKPGKFDQKISCTLSGSIANITGIFDNFNANGLESWISLTTEPQNNYYGQYSMLQSKQIDDLAKAKESGKSEATSGGGFLGRKCTQVDKDAGKCANVGDIMTPGSIVGGTLQNALNAPGEFMSKISANIVEEIPEDYQPYADAIVTAFLSQALQTTMQAMLGRKPDTNFEAAVPEINNVETKESIDAFYLPRANTLSKSLNNLKILSGDVATFLSGIKIKEESLLDNSKRLFNKEPICSLPSFETSLKTSEVISDNTTNQEFTLSATGVGKALLSRTAVQSVPPPLPVTIAVTTIVTSKTAEIIPEIPFYSTDLPFLLGDSTQKNDAYILTLNDYKSSPTQANLNKVKPAGKKVIDSINIILAPYSLNATDLDSAFAFLGQVSDLISDKFGKKEFESFDPADPATTNLNKESYYYKSNVILPGLDKDLNQAISLCN